MTAVVTGGERVGEEKHSTRSMSFVTRFMMSPSQAVDTRGPEGSFGRKWIAQHRQAVDGHGVSGELLEVAGTALEEDHGAPTIITRIRPRAGAGVTRDRPAPGRTVNATS